MTQTEAQAKVEEAEAQVHSAGIAAFEWGCDVAAHTAPRAVVSSPLSAVQAAAKTS